MSQRPMHPVAPEDLSVQVRRGHASRADERALAELTASDEVLRLAHQVGVDVDRDAVVRAGDEDLILRAADAVLARASVTSVATPKRRAFSRLVQVAAAACLMLSAGVVGAWWVASAVSDRAPQPAAEPTVAPSKRAMSKRSATPEMVEAPVAPVPLSDEALEAAGERLDQAIAPRERDKRPVTQDASTLFHAASVARSAGDMTRAQKLYGQLIAQHPDSDEAHVAHVALGKLLLSSGRASAAEREFRQYLDAGGGPLGEEALFSRAQALQRLDRAMEERAAWSKLLSQYPQSVYAERARERLAQQR